MTMILSRVNGGDYLGFVGLVFDEPMHLAADNGKRGRVPHPRARRGMRAGVPVRDGRPCAGLELSTSLAGISSGCCSTGRLAHSHLSKIYDLIWNCWRLHPM